MCGELSNSVLCDVVAITIALCPLGTMCTLDRPWLSPFLLVSLGGWFAASRGQLVLADLRRDWWEPVAG